MVDQELDNVAALRISVHGGRANMNELRNRYVPEVPMTADAIEEDLSECL
jgi:hypothetical protein